MFSTAKETQIDKDANCVFYKQKCQRYFRDIEFLACLEMFQGLLLSTQDENSISRDQIEAAIKKGDNKKF